MAAGCKTLIGFQFNWRVGLVSALLTDQLKAEVKVFGAGQCCQSQMSVCGKWNMSVLENLLNICKLL